MTEGKVVQIISAVVDISFPSGEIPSIYNKIIIERDGQEDLVLEAQQHLGEKLVRCVAMDSTDGLVRGAIAKDTGEPISMPVGECTLGRLINMWGKPIDEQGEIKAEKYYPIHRPAPRIRIRHG